MKITDIKTYVMDCHRTNWVFIKIITDEGITGVGEATLEYKEKALLGAIEDLRAYLIGKNPLNIEEHFYHMYRDSYWREGPVLLSAISCVETALWDILGKFLNVPVYTLLGGKMRDRIRFYANGWFAGSKKPAEFAAKAKETVARGVRALKWDPFGKAYLTMERKELDAALECVARVREAVGPHVDLLIEAHGRFNVATAITIAREIAPYKPMFFEEPVPPENIDALAEVRAKSPVPIAAGERAYTKFAFKEMLEKRAVDFVQPDVSHAGGIMELKKIAAMAEACYIPFAPHNPSGPVAAAATLQLAACVPNFYILEIMIHDVAWRKDVTDESIDYEDGCIKIPDKPGLGINLVEEEVLKHPFSPKSLRHYRGDLTDIRPSGEKTGYYFNNF
jgi:galactonate dehydratase